jgi:REP element-mobilizing transposase RayT
MPRKSRIDAPGALHHIIARGIERRKIFQDDHDCNDFLNRLGNILTETQTHCYAWALIPNHFHLLLRTGSTPISTVMRRLLTGYAGSFNRRHRRYGHLLQNRYKSFLCQEDTYLLELVRYLHLNPLRADLVQDLKQLDTFPYAGHSVVMGKKKKDWQDTDYVLKWFNNRKALARRRYRDFIKKGIAAGKRSDLVGGGLVRSAGGWSALKALRKAKVHLKGDERILGDSDFVLQVLKTANEALEQKYRLKAQGMDIEKIAERVADLLDMSPGDVWAQGKYSKIVNARSMLCFWAVRELGVSMSSLARRLKISPRAVSKSVLRGEKIIDQHKYSLLKK